MKLSEVQLVRSLCRRSYSDFFKNFWSQVSAEPLVWNWHLDVICDHLQREAERVIARRQFDGDTVINVSPGSSKSTAGSVMFPAWVWTIFPQAQFIVASCSHSLALDLSNKCRDVVKSDLYRACFPEVRIRGDMDTKAEFKNTKGGYRVATGSGGDIIGRHGHFIIVDDPIDPTKAISEAEMNATNYWIKNTLQYRKVDKNVTSMTLIMQRLHQDDASAQLLADPLTKHIRLPAELSYAVHPPELKAFYDAAGLMDPIRLPKHFLERALDPRKGLGPFGYAGQFGQDPVPAGGGVIKTGLLKWGKPPDQWKARCRFWDKAISLSRRAAFTVGVLGGIDLEGRFWVLDVIRDHLDSYSRERLIKITARRDGRGVVVGQEEEPGSGGRESAEATARRLIGYRVRTIRVNKSKEERAADELSVQVNASNVWLPEKVRDGGFWVGWAVEYVDELKHFPLSKYKDQVDASSGLMTVLTSGNRQVGAIRRRDRDGAVVTSGAQRAGALKGREQVVLPKAIRVRGH